MSAVKIRTKIFRILNLRIRRNSSVDLLFSNTHLAKIDVYAYALLYLILHQAAAL